jgi:hypothetical protein
MTQLYLKGKYRTKATKQENCIREFGKELNIEKQGWTVTINIERKLRQANFVGELGKELNIGKQEWTVTENK